MDEFRIIEHPSGLIDELVLHSCSVHIQRTGDARYTIRLEEANGRKWGLELWTSRRGRIQTTIVDAEEWVDTALETDGSLKSLDARECDFHLEQMDRGSYWIGLCMGTGPTVHVRVSTNGYLKIKVVSADDPAR